VRAVPEPTASASIEAVVTAADTALALGSGDVEVLGTPRALALAEAATVAAAAGTLTDGQTTVGTRVELDHVAPSPLGATVRAEAFLVVSLLVDEAVFANSMPRVLSAAVS